MLLPCYYHATTILLHVTTSCLTSSYFLLLHVTSYQFVLPALLLCCSRYFHIFPVMSYYHYHTSIMLLLCYYYVSVMLLSCYYHATTMLLTYYFVLLTPSYFLLLDMNLYQFVLPALLSCCSRYFHRFPGYYHATTMLLPYYFVLLHVTTSYSCYFT